MSDDLSGDMLAPSWPNLVDLINAVTKYKIAKDTFMGHHYEN